MHRRLVDTTTVLVQSLYICTCTKRNAQSLVLVVVQTH
jgi:hypothetical protein